MIAASAVPSTCSCNEGHSSQASLQKMLTQAGEAPSLDLLRTGQAAETLTRAGTTAAYTKVCLRTSSSVPGTIIPLPLGIPFGFGNASPHLQNKSIPRIAEMNMMQEDIHHNLLQSLCQSSKNELTVPSLPGLSEQLFMA